MIEKTKYLSLELIIHNVLEITLYIYKIQDERKEGQYVGIKTYGKCTCHFYEKNFISFDFNSMKTKVEPKQFLNIKKFIIKRSINS